MVIEADEKIKKKWQRPYQAESFRPPLHSINIEVMLNHFHLFLILKKFCIKLSQYPNKIKIKIS